MDGSDSTCKECTEAEEVDLEAEVEHLRKHLGERDSHITALEGEYVKCTSRVNDLEEQVTNWREKYERLYDSHKRVQTLNQVLEDKLLQMVDRMKGEKSQLTKDIATLSVRLAESKHSYSMLQNENERYKNDMNLAIQLLQCKPDNFVSHKLDNLPAETQARVSQYVMSKTKAGGSGSGGGKPGPLEPDSFDASEYEFNISASLMSKILEDSVHDSLTKHCDTCTCHGAHAKPFSYDEARYSVATQTCPDASTPLCLKCSMETVKQVTPAASPVTLAKDKSALNAVPMYLIPQPIEAEVVKDVDRTQHEMHRDVLSDVDVDESRHSRRYDAMEPAVHHKLCDRTRTPMSSIKSANSIHFEDAKDPLYTKDSKMTENNIADSTSLRKNSHSSMGAVSRASSIAKSTTSTHRSNTHVGPGPRFCSLRMQAGSKNVLLDNAQPDVPPVLYTRQSKLENSIFKDLNEGVDNFVGLSRNINEAVKDVRDSSVVETTLIDVHVDGSRETESVQGSQVHPALLNVSSSPLRPLKTHAFNGSAEPEHNNNREPSVDSQNNTSQVDVLLNDFNVTNNSAELVERQQTLELDNRQDIEVTSPAAEGMKIFNFDRYEESKSTHQLQFKKVDMSTLENTKISKDAPPAAARVNVNVYPNIARTHLNTEETVFPKEKSTSSLSSDDSAAVLQKQQLIRVAQWVEQNMDRHGVESPEDDFGRGKLARSLGLTNMPHPVSKFAELTDGVARAVRVSNIVKETMFPAEGDGAARTDRGDAARRPNGERKISKEELARMEYNVKKFLLSGPQWTPPAAAAAAPPRSRRTSSKTETDV